MVEQAALGRQPQQLPLHLGNDPAHSTLSDRWLRKAPTAQRWRGESTLVRVLTFAQLVDRYGMPRFAKIDVEGYEAEVIRGARGRLPPVLSFEYQCSDLTVAKACLGLLRGYEFNASRAGSAALDDDSWVTEAIVFDRLRELPHDAYGDIYARRREHDG